MNPIKQSFNKSKGSDEFTPSTIIPAEFDPEYEVVKAAIKATCDKYPAMKSALRDIAHGYLDVNMLAKEMIDNNFSFSKTTRLSSLPSREIRLIIEHIGSSGKMLFLPDTFTSTISYDTDAETIDINFKLEFVDQDRFVWLNSSSIPIEIVSRNSEAINYSGSSLVSGYTAVDNIIEYFNSADELEALLSYAEYASNLKSGTHVPVDLLTDTIANRSAYREDEINEVITTCRNAMKQDLSSYDIVKFYAEKICDTICYTIAESIPQLELKADYEVSELELDDYAY